MPVANDLIENFNWKEYEEYFPFGEEQRSFLKDLLEHRRYGWARRARLLMQLKRQAETLRRSHDQLEALARTLLKNRYRSAKKKPVGLSRRDGLRLYLEGASLEELQGFSVLKNVSFSSFMRVGHEDRTGLIEAIIDECDLTDTSSFPVEVALTQ